MKKIKIAPTILILKDPKIAIKNYFPNNCNIAILEKLHYTVQKAFHKDNTELYNFD